MTAPGNVTLTFDEPAGGYTYGDTVTATVTAVSENTSTVTRTPNVSVADQGTGEATPATGSYTVNDVPDPLQASMTETDAPITWSAGLSTQNGTAFTATFTTHAA